MQNYKEFLKIRQTANTFSKRLKIFIELYKSYHLDKGHKLRILDIGCGSNVELFKFKVKGDFYTGCDYYPKIKTRIDRYIQIDLMSEDLSKRLIGEKYDIIFCGEVIEHLFSPDHLLRQIRSLMHSKSILILSTPNLGYYVNRILLLFGISPLYLENSSEHKLGRRFSFLGQGNITEGHIKIFTYGALLDLFKIEKFDIVKVRGCTTWNFFLDELISKFSNSLNATNVFVLKKSNTELSKK